MSTQKPSPFPTKEQILDFINETPGHVGKREIARAFRLDTDQKRILKKVLKEMIDDGALEKGRGRKVGEPGTIPEVTVLTIIGPDDDGELLARPANWSEEDGEPAIIHMLPERRGQPAPGPGDRVLARLSRTGKKSYDAKTIRHIAAAPPQVLGVYKTDGKQGLIKPTDKQYRFDLMVAPSDINGAEDGDLVRVEVLPGKKLGLKHCRVIEKVGKMDGVESVSLIAIHDHNIRTKFPADAIQQAEKAGPAPLKGRTDLRDTPLVTIDGADARDFDDAVFAEQDNRPDHEGGWHIIVAIADVAWYVKPNSPLDLEAYERGNSVYFPDRVVPMLPEALSNGWCSLVPHEERPCMAAHLWIDKNGNLIKHQFIRGLMKSHARLTYDQVQAARDGKPDDITGPLMKKVIDPLYGAYEVLNRAREERGVLDLDLPEKKIIIGEDGKVEKVTPRERFDSHKLIEEFMILANVAAAETLELKKQPCMYRIHDEPPADKVDVLREFLGTVDLKLAKGQVMMPKHFNQILSKAKDTPNSHLVSDMVLRTQSQAVYSPDNIGHFGLALTKYCHFTSPIRRYADLLVHRALIRGCRLGPGALEDDHKDFHLMGKQISGCERKAVAAERSAIDRFTALYLADQVGNQFSGRITGVAKFGLFVTLSESGGDGLIPISTLPEDFYHFDERHMCLTGRRKGMEFTMGDMVEVTLMEAEPLTGSLILAIAGHEPADGGPRHRRGRGHLKDRGAPPRTKNVKGGRKGSRAARRRRRNQT